MDFNDFSADDFDAMSDIWEEEEEYWDDPDEDEDEVERKLAEFGLVHDADFDDLDDDDDTRCPECGAQRESSWIGCSVCGFDQEGDW